MNDWMLRDLLTFYKIDIKTNSYITEANAQGAVIKTKNGDELLVADTIILAVGFKKENDLYEELKFDIGELYNIGDSREVRNIRGDI